MIATQKSRFARVESPLGNDVFLFRSMTATEELGRMFVYELKLFSNDHNISLEDVLAQSLTVVLELPDGERFYNGIVSQFTYGGMEDDYAVYHARLHPWLWFLTRTADCKIFQKMSVPAIIKQIFNDAGFSEFEDQLTATYREWDYCVQYRETAHDFICRLMEQEGIYFYFSHEDDNHKLVMADSYAAHDVTPGYDTIKFYHANEANGSQRRDEEHVFEWQVTKQVQPGSFGVKDFDFENPGADLTAKLNEPDAHLQNDAEIFDYPGEYVQAGEGDACVRIMLERYKAKFERVAARTNARGVTVGGLFTLTQFPRDDQNREYLVVKASYELISDSYRTSSQGGDAHAYECSFEAIESSRPYRTPPTTGRPMIRGPQTAMIVGKSGDEIHTDKYGRVRVQFHWDRYGTSDENSSCWVRVAQVWAGKQWGGIQIPRVGQEVIVEFLEGDPDRPIITGRVYNAEQMPPYDLPANKTQSGIKSRSSKSGSAEDFNEFRFEDKKGSEEVYLHAQKDWNTIVENDRTTEIGHDDTLKIGNNRTSDVGSNEKHTVGANRDVTVQANQTHKIMAKRDCTVAASDTLKVGATQSITVGASQSTTIAATQSTTVGASQSTTVAATITMTAGGGVTITAPMVTLNAAMVTVTGVLQATTVIASASVVSPTYTPGVGNIM